MKSGIVLTFSDTAFQAAGFREGAGLDDHANTRVPEERWHRLTMWVLCVLLVAIVVRQGALHGMHFSLWDWMLISGLVVFLGAAHLAHRLPHRQDDMLATLGERQVLVSTDHSMPAVLTAIRAERQRWRLFGGLISSMAIAAAFISAMLHNNSLAMLWLGLVETAIAFPAGRYLGAMAHSSVLSRSLRRQSVAIVVRPGALDGTGGLKPVGDFFFVQASVVSLPALFLAVWLMAIPGFDRYAEWTVPYSGLLALALVCTGLSFVAPLWAFHREMRRQKKAYAPEANAVAVRINALKDALLASADQASRSRLRAEIDAETRLYREFDTMPVWPIAPVTLRRFTINNSILSFPLIMRALDEFGLGGDLVRWFTVQFT